MNNQQFPTRKTRRLTLCIGKRYILFSATVCLILLGVTALFHIISNAYDKITKSVSELRFAQNFLQSCPELSKHFGAPLTFTYIPDKASVEFEDKTSTGKAYFNVQGSNDTGIVVLHWTGFREGTGMLRVRHGNCQFNGLGRFDETKSFSAQKIELLTSSDNTELIWEDK